MLSDNGDTHLIPMTSLHPHIIHHYVIIILQENFNRHSAFQSVHPSPDRYLPKRLIALFANTSAMLLGSHFTIVHVYKSVHTVTTWQILTYARWLQPEEFLLTLSYIYI